MIEIELIEAMGFEGAIKGMRNPYKNREKSDSGWLGDFDNDIFHYQIGPKDLELCQKLLRSGEDSDSKFMRMIHVQADVNAPLYWWKEFDTYKVATTANSESTMHTIHSREFVFDDFSHDCLIDNYTLTKDKKNFTDEYDFGYVYASDADEDIPIVPLDLLVMTVQHLNTIRNLYLKAREEDNKSDMRDLWYNMIQLLPSSYMQKRTIDLDYQTLRRIFFARRHHKLKEWSGPDSFCEWIKSLPYAEDLICYDPKPPVKVIIEKSKRDTISNLLTDMTLNGASSEEIANVTKYSLMVLDCDKAKKELGISELLKKYSLIEEEEAE